MISKSSVNSFGSVITEIWKPYKDSSHFLFPAFVLHHLPTDYHIRTVAKSDINLHHKAIFVYYKDYGMNRQDDSLYIQNN